VSTNGTPVYGTIIVGILASILASVFSIQILVETISIGTLVSFTIVNCSVIILRYQEQTAKGSMNTRDLNSLKNKQTNWVAG
jgi:amino acid transporter